VKLGGMLWFRTPGVVPVVEQSYPWMMLLLCAPDDPLML